MVLKDFNVKNNKYTKIILVSLVFVFLISIVFINYFNNIRKNGEISRAKQSLYEVTNTDREQVEFKIEESCKYLKGSSKAYHIFRVLKSTGEECEFNYLVEKSSFEVFICDKKGLVIPYEDYQNSDSVLGNYFEELQNMNYNNIPPATKDYLEKNGGISLLKKVEEIIEKSNITAVDEWGGIIKYVDLIINGVKIETLNNREN